MKEFLEPGSETVFSHCFFCITMLNIYDILLYHMILIFGKKMEIIQVLK